MTRFGSGRAVVIGGNAAGMTAASRIRRLDPGIEVTVLERSGYISYSICGAPYLVDGTVGKAEDLLALTPAKARAERGIEVRTHCEVVRIAPGRREIEVRDPKREKPERVPFDWLVLATGYRPDTGGIEGAEHPAVFSVSRMEDVIRIGQVLEQDRPRSAAVVGGGYIGLNMAESLVRRGLAVTLFQKAEHLFPAADAEVAGLIEDECRRAGIKVLTLTRVDSVEIERDRTSGVIAEGTRFGADLVLVDIGVKPEVSLAADAGVALGVTGAVQVSTRMETSQNGIYAAGNCAEATHLITGRPVISALGTHASRQGRVAAENITGMRTEFTGVLQTSVARFFGISVATTGLTLREAERLGFNAGAVFIQAPARAAYFPPRERIAVKLVYEKSNGRILGAQVAGPPWTAKRIDTAAVAITAGMTLEQVAMLDLAYSPPHAPLWDPLQVAANAALRQVRGRGGMGGGGEGGWGDRRMEVFRG